MSALLALENVSASYGPVRALSDVSLDVAPGEVVSLIGANGAGKSTLLMTICGRPKPGAGRIMFDGRDITGWPTHRVARAGIAHVPEGRRIFPRMSVAENLLLGAQFQTRAAFSAARAEILARLPRLAERLHQAGGTLSGGEQQMLAIARAFVSRPRLLLLDEPSLGLAPLMIREIFALIADLARNAGVPVLLVEQNAAAALRLADRGYVLANGRITLAGTGAALLADPRVRDAYLAGAAGPSSPGHEA